MHSFEVEGILKDKDKKTIEFIIIDPGFHKQSFGWKLLFTCANISNRNWCFVDILPKNRNFMRKIVKIVTHLIKAVIISGKNRYSKVLRCTFLGEWKNLRSSKFVELELFNKAKARSSKNHAA